jgi:hypothetical protein
MSTKHVRTAADLVRFGSGLRVDCGTCGAYRTMDGFEVARTAGTGSLAAIARRMRCSRCGAKDAQFALLVVKITRLVPADERQETTHFQTLAFMRCSAHELLQGCRAEHRNGHIGLRDGGWKHLGEVGASVTSPLSKPPCELDAERYIHVPCRRFRRHLEQICATECRSCCRCSSPMR